MIPRACLLAILLTAAAPMLARAGPPLDLDARAPPLAPIELQRQLDRGGHILVFDIRSEAEYSVSHLAGARRVDEAESPARFLAAIRNETAKARIVFYCTVGVRSQVFADGVLHDLMEAGAKDVSFLDGGIIAWSNDRRPLVWRNGATVLVHPHDAATARRVHGRWHVRFAPR